MKQHHLLACLSPPMAGNLVFKIHKFNLPILVLVILLWTITKSCYLIKLVLILFNMQTLWCMHLHLHTSYKPPNLRCTKKIQENYNSRSILNLSWRLSGPHLTKPPFQNFQHTPSSYRPCFLFFAGGANFTNEEMEIWGNKGRCTYLDPRVKLKMGIGAVHKIK